MKNVSIRYYSIIGANPGTQTASYQTEADNVRDLLHEIQAAHAIHFSTSISKAAVNEVFVEWDAPFQDGDTITFLPPFSGG